MNNKERREFAMQCKDADSVALSRASEIILEMLDNELLATRNVYRLQTGNGNLCDALRKIVALDVEPASTIALKALNNKLSDKDCGI